MRFEALLRGKAVTCYGQPFYSGWGLTDGITPHTCRTRRLQLDALVAGALLLYPLCLSLAHRRLITPEQALDELLACKTPWWQGIDRFFLRRFIGVR